MVLANNVTAYEGKVVATRHENLGQDSHFYAYVWENGKIVEIEDGSTAYGGPRATAKVDATSDVVSLVSDMLVNDLRKALDGNHYADVAPKVGSRVKSLTTRGKAYGVVGEIVGEGHGTHGPFFRVKDEKSGRVVIVSRNKVSVLDMGVLDKECLALHVALGILGKSKRNVMVSGYAIDPKGFVADQIKSSKESMARNMEHYATTDELMSDFRQDGNAHAFILANRLV